MINKDITIGYACLNCRKTYKKYKYKQDNRGNWEAVKYNVVCPQCSNDMYITGSAFKAPKSSNSKAWEKLKPLFEGGYIFHPDFGNPFDEKTTTKIKQIKIQKSEFRKPARKRNKK